MKNLLKTSILTLFVLFVSVFSNISIVSAYSATISFDTANTSFVPSIGYPMQTSRPQSIPYNGSAKIKWSTIGFSSCTCTYWDYFSQQTKNCTPSTGPTASTPLITNIYSTLMQNLKNNVVDSGNMTSNSVNLSCVPTPCIAGSTSILGYGVSSGSWTVPAVNTGYDNCTFKVEAWGGGGGGHGGHGDVIFGSGAVGGAGGGAGGYHVMTGLYGGAGPLYFYPGSLLTYTIGYGGGVGAGGSAGNNAGSQGTGGGNTAIAIGGVALMGAQGGGAGLWTGIGGSGGSGTTYGGNGGNYNTNTSQYGGDGGSSPNGGAGGAAHGNNGNNTNGNTGDNGIFPGGGGAGGGGADGGASAHVGGTGGQGATGAIRISWY